MIKWLQYGQVAAAVLMILVILLQQRGTSLGGAFGGETAVYRSRRGFEKFLFYATIIIAVIFVTLAVSELFVH